MNMRNIRVVITGIGLLTPVGNNLAAFHETIFAGQSMIGPLGGFKLPNERFSYGGQIKHFDFAQEMPEVNGKRLLRFSQFALTATKYAIADAGLQLDSLNRQRIATSFSTSIAGAGETFHIEGQRFQARGERGVSPFAWSEFTPCACTTHIAIHFGLRGPVSTHSSGCVSGLDTIAWGMQQLRQGNADVVVAGGADAPFFPLLWAGLSRSGVLAPAPEDDGNIPRPFSFDHNGIAISEGASALILETETHARLRGARIYGEICGAASVEEARPLTDIDPEGHAYTEAIVHALDEAGLPPTAVDWMQAHGTGFPGADIAESLGIERAFGKHAFCIPVSSIRGSIGQPFASGAGWQVAAACLALRDQRVPPTINFTRPAVGCNLDYVPNAARVARIKTIVTAGAGIGGIHGAVVITDYA